MKIIKLWAGEKENCSLSNDLDFRKVRGEEQNSLFFFVEQCYILAHRGNV